MKITYTTGRDITPGKASEEDHPLQRRSWVTAMAGAVSSVTQTVAVDNA